MPFAIARAIHASRPARSPIVTDRRARRRRLDRDRRVRLRRGQRLEPLHERLEVVLARERQQPAVVDGAVQLVERGRHRCRVAQGHQAARQARLLGMIEQVLAALGLLDGRRPGQQILEAAELDQQLRRGLDPDAGHARNIVGGVAGQREDVADPLRPDPEARDHLVAIDRLLLHRVVHLDRAADQLHQVLVGGDDDHLAVLLAGVAGIGGDHVVGLVALQLDHRQVEGMRRLAHQRELRHEIVGRLHPVRLVGVVHGVAEALAALVEDHHQLVARHVLGEAEQHVAEAEHGADRHAFGVGQRRQREERAEDVSRAVDEHETGLTDFRGGGGAFGHGVALIASRGSRPA